MLPHLLNNLIQEQLDNGSDLDIIFDELLENKNVATFDIKQAGDKFNYTFTQAYIDKCVLIRIQQYNNRAGTASAKICSEIRKNTNFTFKS